VSGARAVLMLPAAETRTRCWRVGPGRLAAASENAVASKRAATSERAAASERVEGEAAWTALFALLKNWLRALQL